MSATKLQLIESAGEAFAEAGFHAATIRDISRRAHANIAAINYHFGSKERLYIAVLQYAHGCAVAQHPLQSSEPSQLSLPPETRLRVFIRGVLMRQLAYDRVPWFGKLMIREMMEPTGILDALVEQSIRPEIDLISDIVRDLIGHDAGSDERRVELCVMSILGQCLFFSRHSSLPLRRRSKRSYRKQEVNLLVDHIADFSLLAIRQLASSNQPAKRLVWP